MAGQGWVTSPASRVHSWVRDEAVDRTSTVAFDLVFSFRFALTLLVFCRCVGRIVQSKLSVGFFSLFTVGLARPPASRFLSRHLLDAPRCSLFCARTWFSLLAAISTLHVWDLRESGGRPGSKKICLRFPVLFLHSLFFFFFLVLQNASQPAERKFIFWAVRTNFPLCPIMPICLSPPPPASHRERISPKLLIAEKRIKMNFPHERRDKFPNFRSMTQIFRLLTTAGLRLSRVKENQGATLCRFRVVASLPFSLFAYSRPFTTRYNLHRSDFRRGDLG